MNTKPISPSGQDLSDKGAPKVSAAPFATKWENHRPLAHGQGLSESPGGTLSPQKLAGVGKGK